MNTIFNIGPATGAAAGDFNGDGRADVAWYQGGTLHLFGGMPNGAFSYEGSSGVIGAPSYVVASG